MGDRDTAGMTHHELILLFAQFGVMLASALLFGQLMRRLHQPAVLGELIGGIVLGPTVLGMALPALHGWLFPDSAILLATRDVVIKLGMLFFLFVAGLEVKLGHLRGRGLSVLLTSVLGVALPLLIGLAVVRWWPGLWGAPAERGGLVFALFIGVALSISALPVIARILMDLQLLQSEIGTLIMAAATMNDLVGWTLFAVILGAIAPVGLGQTPGVLFLFVAGFTAAVLALGPRLSQALTRRFRASALWPNGFIGLIAVLLLLVAALAESIGIHAVFGAFLVGVAFGQGFDQDNQAHDTIHQFAISFFAPLYFVSIGLQTNFALNFNPPLVLLVFVIACVGKVVGAGAGAWAGGMALREAVAVGFGMNARGAMEIILASVALEFGLIDVPIFVALVVMALATSMLSGPVMQRLLRTAPAAEVLVRM